MTETDSEKLKRIEAEVFAPVKQREEAIVRGEVMPTSHEAHVKIITKINLMRQAWISLAEDLYMFQQRKQYEELGYTSLRDWASDPDVDLEFRQIYALIEIWRELAVKRKIDPGILGDHSMSKLSTVLPAIRRRLASPEAAMADAAALTRRDLKLKYGSAMTKKALNAGGLEPIYQTCSHCGSSYVVRSVEQ